MRWVVRIEEDSQYVVPPTVRIVEGEGMTWTGAIAAAMEDIPLNYGSSASVRLTAEMAR